jgi:acetylornithine deacetylase
VSWSGGQFAGGQLPAEHPLRERVAEAHCDATGSPRPRERGAPYGSDLRLYAAEGIPTLHYGPGEVRLAHSPDESVEVSEVLDVARVLTLSLLRECGAS